MAEQPLNSGTNSADKWDRYPLLQGGAHVLISEVRPEELPQMRQLFDEQLPSNLALPLGLSLVARDGNTIVAAIVCVREANGYACRYAVAPEYADSQLTKQLVDKALLKLHSHRIHKCRIQMDEAFFGNVRWMATTHTPVATDSPECPDEATPDRPAVAAEQRSPAEPIAGTR